MLCLSAREVSRGSSAGSAFTLEWAERRVQPSPTAAASSLQHTAAPGKQRCRAFTRCPALGSFACSEISARTCLTGVWSDWEIPALPHPLPPHGDINLQQWNIILQVCEGTGANAAGEKAAAPEEGLVGFSPACQPDRPAAATAQVPGGIL